MEKRTKRYLTFLTILIFILVWVLILNFLSPSEIVEKLGARNSYMILFLISAIGGVSLITASSYYIAISVLAIAGLNPILLGLFGGIGVTIGDSLYFYLGSKGKEISSKNIDKRLKKISKLLKKSPKWLIPFMVYIYSGFTLLPNDLMTFSLGIIGYSYKKIFLPLILGNITVTTIIAYLSIFGINFF